MLQYVCVIFFNLTLSHEHFFISLNIYGRHHSKLFTSPSDRTLHSACNAPAQGCSGRQFCDPGLWRLGTLPCDDGV